VSGATLLQASIALAQSGQPIVLETVTLEGGAGGAGGGGATTGVASSGVTTPAGAVSATKGAGNPRATPQVVSVVGRDQLEKRDVQTVDEATRYSAGIQGQKYGSNNRLDWFNIRGFPAEADGLFLDGLALFSTAFASWRIDPVALDRVEVLRGPASVLYGGSSPGGIVNLVSKRPTKTRQGEIEAGVNEFGQGYVSLDSGGPLDDQALWSYRLNAKIFGGDQYAEEGDEFEGVVAPSINWSPDGDTSLTVYGYYQNDDSNNTPGFLPYVGTVRPASYGRIERDFFSSEPGVDTFERDQAMIGYEFEHTFNETFTVRQNTRYSHLDSTYRAVYGFGYAPGSTTDINRIDFLTTPEADAFNVDTQGEARFATGEIDHVLLAGIDYRFYELSDNQAVGGQSRINVVRPIYGLNIAPIGSPYIDNTQTLNQTGLYLQDQMTYDKLVVTLNGRYDFLDTELDNRIAGQKDASSDEGAFSGRAGAAYLFDNGITPYVSYSRFFTPVLGLDADTNQPFDSGDGDQYEVGIKYQPSDLDMVLTASLFDLTRRNTLTRDVRGGRPFTDVQTGEIQSQGVEFEANVGLGNGFSMLAAFTAMDIDVTKSSGADLGKVPTATPEEFGSLWLDYTVQSGAAEGLRVGAGVRYVGDSWADRANTFKVPDYTVVDAAVSYETPSWRGQLNASNLFDKRTVQCGPDENSCFYGDARKVSASLAYKF
jgi:iron complex outermembrane receptor protein